MITRRMYRMSPEDYFRITGNKLPPRKSKGSKYNNQKTASGYDSKLEEGRAGQLRLELKLWLIHDLEEQVPIVIHDSFTIKDPSTKSGYRKIPAIKYLADFRYRRDTDDKYTIEDSKGFRTDVYKIKRKLFLKRYQEEYIFIETIDKKGTQK